MRTLLLAVVFAAVSAAAQTSYPSAPPARGGAPVATAPANRAPADASQLLAELDQTASAVKASLSRLRIDKWKTDGPSRSQYQSNADSISRNITEALPGIAGAVRTSPSGMAANFKLYRNVSALYDVFASLTEAAGAFGPKEDSQELSRELQQVDSLRRAFGDRVNELAVSGDAELAKLRAQVKQAPAAPPKKVVVDNGDQTPPPKKKKKTSTSAAQSKPQTPQQ